jgi:hypothetical protein
MKTLYHYTSEVSFNAIISTKTLNSTDPWTTTDAAYGHGWYMTDLDPKTCDIAIALRCWKDIEALGKVESYLQFEVDDSVFIECRKNVFLIQKWETEKIKYVKGEKIPNCDKRPCETCDKGKEIIKNSTN